MFWPVTEWFVTKVIQQYLSDFFSLFTPFTERFDFSP